MRVCNYGLFLLLVVLFESVYIFLATTGLGMSLAPQTHPVVLLFKQTQLKFFHIISFLDKAVLINKVKCVFFL